MIIAELGKLRTPQERKPVIPKRVAPFKFKNFQSETNGHWTNIGRALTNRYHKFQEQEGKDTGRKEYNSSRGLELPSANNSIEFGRDKRDLTPRFQIKRKYLSFNAEKLEKRTITSLKTEYPTNSSGQNNHLNCSFLFDKHNQFLLNKEALSQGKDLSGTYFIPKSKNPCHKFKYILYRKGRKKNSANPELLVAPKFKEAKQCGGEIRRDKIKRVWEGQAKITRRYRSLERQETYFRPWSSKQEQL